MGSEQAGNADHRGWVFDIVEFELVEFVFKRGFLEYHFALVAAERRLVRWYREHGRHDLPWRAQRDPWVILMTEVLLQQTQVSRVLAVWDDFQSAYPTPQRLAQAGLADILTRWNRMGYPRRARGLHSAAQHISVHGWPSNLEVLPGIGSYTAAAVRIHAENSDELALDTNIRRAVKRYAGDAERSPLTVSRQLGHPLEPRHRFWALMDLGAAICLPNPRCGQCPLRSRCATRGRHEDERQRATARYEGSFRQQRGEVLAALRRGPALAGQYRPAAVDSLIAEGLIVREDKHLRLP